MLVTVLALLVISAGVESGHWDERVIGGSEAAPGAFPFAASLQNRSTHYCTAAIISTTCIISNAACLKTAKENSFNVLIGTQQLNTGGTRLQLASIFVPETYNPKTFYHNIGLGKVTPTIVFSATVKPIRLTDKAAAANSMPVFVGWGFTTTAMDVLPNSLQFITLTLLANEQCQPVPNYTTEDKLCTANVVGKSGLCKHDHGGPLFVGKALTGISSTMVECVQGYPDTFEDVFKWRQWIIDNCGLPQCV